MDQQSLQFHIQENDYFGTLATVLDLLGQDLRRHGHVRHADMLHRLRNDLTYLQRRYRIEEISEFTGALFQQLPDKNHDKLS